MGHAGASEVVVSRTVVDLVAGSQLDVRGARHAQAQGRARASGSSTPPRSSRPKACGPSRGARCCDRPRPATDANALAARAEPRAAGPPGAARTKAHAAAEDGRADGRAAGAVRAVDVRRTLVARRRARARRGDPRARAAHADPRLAHADHRAAGVEDRLLADRPGRARSPPQGLAALPPERDRRPRDATRGGDGARAAGADRRAPPQGGRGADRQAARGGRRPVGRPGTRPAVRHVGEAARRSVRAGRPLDRAARRRHRRAGRRAAGPPLPERIRAGGARRRRELGRVCRSARSTPRSLRSSCAASGAQPARSWSICRAHSCRPPIRPRPSASCPGSTRR